MKRLFLLFVACCLLAIPMGVQAQMDDATLVVGESAELGSFLTDAEGMTLYIFTKDEVDSGVSVCNDDCATNWPPFFVEGATLPEGTPGELTVITRDDGSSQVAFNGMPLYYYAADTAAGDTNGQAVGDVWWVASIETSAPASPVAAGTLLVAETAELGAFLTDSQGMTLYVFSKDEADSGVSVCNDDCAANWPPYFEEGAMLPEGTPGELTVITRDDGSSQTAYNGQPLYYYAADTAAGDTNGQAVGDVWWVAPVAEPGGM